MKANSKIKKVKSPQEKALQRLEIIFHCLADQTRLKILQALMINGDQHVGALCDLLLENQPIVSHHLSVLKVAGLVDYIRDGRFNHYFLASESIRDLLKQLELPLGRNGLSLYFGDLEINIRSTRSQADSQD